MHPRDLVARARTEARAVRAGTRAVPVRGRGRGETVRLLRGRSVLTGFVVDTFDAWGLRDAVTREVAAALTRAGVEHLVVPAVGPEPHRVVVPATRARGAAAALGDVRGEAPLHVQRVRGTARTGTAHALAGRFPLRLSGGDVVRVFPVLLTLAGRPLRTEDLGVDVELWTPAAGPTRSEDGPLLPAGTLLAPRPGPRVMVLRPGELQDPPPAVTAPAIESVGFPVDVVYTWVDSADPEWQERHREAVQASEGEDLNATARSASRFASRDELRHSLRSVAAYASWVRRIHVVTDGQVPDWLDTSHPKIRLVAHKDIFPDPSVLPTFNSHAIESCLHRIPGLAEHYLYLNDDVFLAGPTRPERFFTPAGQARYFPSMVPVDDSPVTSEDIPIVAAFKNGRTALEEHFGRRPLTRLRHTPHPQRRDVLLDIEEALAEEVARTRASHFRTPSDVSLASQLHAHWGEATGRAVSSDIGYEFVHLGDPDADAVIDRLLSRGDVEAFCLNETDVPDDGMELVHTRLSHVLDTMLPLRSPFER